MGHKETVKVALIPLLFFNFFKIALFVIGGGLVMVPMIEDIFVRHYRLLKKKDILNMLAIMQTMPGMMAVNAAIFVGHKLAGFKGALVASVGVILPSVLIIILIAATFQNLDIQNPHILKAFSCVRACATALFVGTALELRNRILCDKRDYIIVGIFCMALMFGFSQITLILCSIPVGWGIILWDRNHS